MPGSRVALGIATPPSCCWYRAVVAPVARDAQGIDLAVGAGPPLQLILSAIYHVDVPTGNIPFAAVDELRSNRLVAQAIPVSLGDNFRGFRIVGTEPALLDHYGAKLAAGRRWEAAMEAVIGADVARRTGLAVGGTLHGTHGLADGGAVHEDAIYAVVGILAPTATVLDRLIATDKAASGACARAAGDEEERILSDEREVTALLVRYASPMAAAIVPRQVNAESRLMAASPASELARLLPSSVSASTRSVPCGDPDRFCARSSSRSTRPRGARCDIAIMRLLGASRHVAGLLLLEAWLALVAAATCWRRLAQWPREPVARSHARCGSLRNSRHSCSGSVSFPSASRRSLRCCLPGAPAGWKWRRRCAG
jgi:putative ABC transport system permease protein